MKIIILLLFTGCGGYYTNETGILTSPSYPDPYPPAQDCIYIVSQPIGTYLKFTVTAMDINCHDLGSDYLQISDGKSEDSPLMGRFCGDEGSMPESMQTTQNHLRLR